MTGKFIGMIDKLNPTFFLLENVPGLLETKKHRKYLFSQLEKLSKKYAIDMKILNSLEYGVPQSRRRLFVVGMKLKWLSGDNPDYKSIKQTSDNMIGIKKVESKTNNEIAAEIEKLHWFEWPNPRLKDAVAVISSGKKKCPDELTVGKCFAKINGHKNAEDVFKARSRKITQNSIKQGDTSRKSFKRLHLQSFSPNAAYGNNEVHLHPTKARRISVAEALALQGIPGKYSFPKDMTLTAKFKAVGNGVPVPLAKSMAGAILTFIKKRTMR